MLEIPKPRAGTARQRAALEEMTIVAEWASADTAEWVRVIGALSEAYSGEAEGPRLGAQFESLVRGLLAPARTRYSDLEALVRQLREREYHRAAYRAATIAAEIDPGSSYAQSVCANCASLVGDERAALAHERRCAELLEESADPDAEHGWRRVAVRARNVGDAELARFGEGRAEALRARPPVPKEPEPPPVNWLAVSWDVNDRYPEAADAEAAPPLVTPPTTSELDAYERADQKMWATLLCLLLRRRQVAERAVESPPAVLEAFLARRGRDAWVAIAEPVCKELLPSGDGLRKRALRNLAEWLSGEVDEELEEHRKAQKVVGLIEAAKRSLALGRWDEATENVAAARMAAGESPDSPPAGEAARILAATQFAQGEYDKALSDLKSIMVLEALFGADPTRVFSPPPVEGLPEHEAALREVACLLTHASTLQSSTLQRAFARLCASLPPAEGSALADLIAAKSAAYQSGDDVESPKKRKAKSATKKSPPKK